MISTSELPSKVAAHMDRLLESEIQVKVASATEQAAQKSRNCILHPSGYSLPLGSSHEDWLRLMELP